MDKINKALLKLTSSQRAQLLAKFELVVDGALIGLDVKKLKGHTDLYRLRVGDTRLVYRLQDGQKPVIIFVGRCDNQTYRDF